ncbi:MAG: pseudouridine synthase [Prolixibacteraceae bacterium]
MKKNRNKNDRSKRKESGESDRRSEKRSSSKRPDKKNDGSRSRASSKPKDRREFQRPEKRVSKGRAKTTGSEEMRLNRYIANAGVCSRREADKYIQAGVVTVNGKTVTELGVKVKPEDDVRFDGRRLNPEQKVYLLLNKPKGFVTTTEDPHAERTVMDLVENACSERIYPVGRLDKTTTGLLLFTNDGDLSKKLTHPGHKMKKIYQVSLDKPVTKNHILQIAEGVELDDGMIAADAVSYIHPDDKTEVGIEIHSGKNRVVRRIFENLGYRVKKLDRVYFAGLTKKRLPRGKFRFLSKNEIQFLKMQ